MTAFSLGTIWEETIAFLRRENGLLIPVALAIYGPAHLLVNHAAAAATNMRSAVEGTPDAKLLLIFPGLLLYVFGNLVVTRLVLTPGGSVGEAMTSARQRVPTALAATLLVATGLTLAGLAIVVAATLGAIVFRADPRSPAMGDELFVLLTIPMIIVAVRMMPLVTVLAMERLGAAESIRRAWALGRKNMFRFFGVFLLAGFIGIFIGLIEQFVIGSLIQLLGLATGGGEFLSALKTLINAAIDSLLSLGLAVYIALIYRRIAVG